MNRIFFLTLSLFISFCATAQITTPIWGDSVALKSRNGNAELIIENSTRNVKGFLYNNGNGRTVFRPGAIRLNDSTYIVGADTIKIKGGVSSLQQAYDKQGDVFPTINTHFGSFSVDSVYYYQLRGFSSNTEFKYLANSAGHYWSTWNHTSNDDAYASLQPGYFGIQTDQFGRQGMFAMQGSDVYIKLDSLGTTPVNMLWADAQNKIHRGPIPAGTAGNISAQLDSFRQTLPDESVYLTEEYDPLFQSSAANSITQADIDNWNNGTGGAAGRGVTSVAQNGSGHLIITYSDATTQDAGYVIGSAGTNGTNGTNGIGISSAAINGSNHLIITYSNSSTQDVGLVVGPAGAAGATGNGISSASITAGHLVLNYTNGGAQDLGNVVGTNGAAGQGFNFRGAFQPNTVYNAYDVVTNGGSSYEADHTFTSGGTFSTGMWNVWAAKGIDGINGTNGTGTNGTNGTNGQGFNFRGAWAASTSYVPYDVVTFGGNTYESSTSFTSTSSFNSANWNLWAAKGVDGSSGGSSSNIDDANSTTTTTYSSSKINSLVSTKLTITNYIVRETPSGTVNGTNKVFTLANTPVTGTESVKVNGLEQEPGSGNDYTISGTTITFINAPFSTDKIRVTYFKQ